MYELLFKFDCFSWATASATPLVSSLLQIGSAALRSISFFQRSIMSVIAGKITGVDSVIKT